MLTIYHLTHRLLSKCSLMTQRCTERSPTLKMTLEPFKRTSFVFVNWATLWQLRFNPEKCETMRINHSRDRLVQSYTVGSGITPVKCTKVLGFLFSSDLSWSAVVYRQIEYRTLGPSNVEATLWKTLERPILEYAAPVWCPWLAKDILALEKVQRRASRLA